MGVLTRDFLGEVVHVVVAECGRTERRRSAGAVHGVPCGGLALHSEGRMRKCWPRRAGGVARAPHDQGVTGRLANRWRRDASAMRGLRDACRVPAQWVIRIAALEDVGLPTCSVHPLRMITTDRWEIGRGGGPGMGA